MSGSFVFCSKARGCLPDFFAAVGDEQGEVSRLHLDHRRALHDGVHGGCSVTVEAKLHYLQLALVNPSHIGDVVRVRPPVRVGGGASEQCDGCAQVWTGPGCACATFFGPV